MRDYFTVYHERLHLAYYIVVLVYFHLHNPPTPLTRICDEDWKKNLIGFKANSTLCKQLVWVCAPSCWLDLMIWNRIIRTQGHMSNHKASCISWTGRRPPPCNTPGPVAASRRCLSVYVQACAIFVQLCSSNQLSRVSKSKFLL